MVVTAFVPFPINIPFCVKEVTPVPPLLTFIFAIFVWQWPTIEQIVWMAMLAILGTISQLALTEAFRHADATLVLPADFTKVIWASLIGYFFFNQVPEIWVGLGAIVICSAVFYNTYSESRYTRSDISSP